MMRWAFVALDLFDARQAPFGVEHKLGFDRFEIDRAALLPRLEQRPEHLVQELQTRQETFSFRAASPFGSARAAATEV